MMKTTRLATLLVIASVAAASVVAGGCQKTLSSAKVATADSSSETMVAARTDAPLQAGALMWSQNCARCHNLRNPSEHSDREWDVIALHMRVRANLTAKEHRLILAFLKSAN